MEETKDQLQKVTESLSAARLVNATLLDEAKRRGEVEFLMRKEIDELKDAVSSRDKHLANAYERIRKLEAGIKTYHVTMVGTIDATSQEQAACIAKIKCNKLVGDFSVDDVQRLDND